MKKIGVGRPELAIELLKAMQGQGIGTHAIRLLMAVYKKIQKLIEDKNKHLIDEKMRRTAEKFGVEPQKLLSHILEYKLVTD